MEFTMGLFILRWRTPGRSDDLSVHIYNLLFKRIEFNFNAVYKNLLLKLNFILIMFT